MLFDRPARSACARRLEKLPPSLLLEKFVPTPNRSQASANSACVGIRWQEPIAVVYDRLARVDDGALNPGWQFLDNARNESAVHPVRKTGRVKLIGPNQALHP
jgi:hypothetical protein